ncbi:MAG: hypothetical protein PHQ40_00460 [Anaerolineaceae bacterium]|nr:hypothetical protein [Anaerolineaceae bacterium]MDD5367528.1 hypothetical protein [Anaerolineaceae bacterium]
MKIIEIRAGWEETCSLPEYCNVRPSVHYTATVEEGEDPIIYQENLLQMAKEQVRNQVDEALEMANRPPKYYQGQRAQIILSREHRTIVVLDDMAEWPAGYTQSYEFERGLRPETALKKADEKAKGLSFQLVNCLDGDFSKLPQEDEMPF